MTYEEMVSKYNESLVQVFEFGDERNNNFANKVSRHANDNFGLNAAATTSEGNALIEALDNFF